MEKTKLSKEYIQGYDYYISGGRGQEYNPFSFNTDKNSDWLQGYQDAEREEQDYESFSDIH